MWLQQTEAEAELWFQHKRLWQIEEVEAEAVIAAQVVLWQHEQLL